MNWRQLLQRIQRLSVPEGRRRDGAFTLEGFRSMERALRNRAPLEAVLLGESFRTAPNLRKTRILEALEQRGIPLHFAPDEALIPLTGGRGLGDIFAILPLPPAPELSTLFTPSGRRLLVVGWNLGDPGNTGAVIRSALAAGACGFLAIGTTDPWHPKSVRTSMGSLFALPILRLHEDSPWLDTLHQLNVHTLATVCRDAVPLPNLPPLPDRLALIMGSEAFGLPDPLAALARLRVTIPMPPNVDSYSINAATAVLAYTLMHRE